MTTGLPGLVAEVLDLWGLTPAGPVIRGASALVLPVDGAGEPAMLKVADPPAPSTTEHLALRRWDGAGAVRLLRASPRVGALLLERLPGPSLVDHWDEEACGIAAEVMMSLASPPLPAATSVIDWAGGLAEGLDGAPLPQRVRERARRVARARVARVRDEPDTTLRLVHGNLGYGHVLADGDRWRAISPEAINAPVAFEFAPLLWERAEELGTGPSLRYGVRRRLEILGEGTDTRWEDARDWSLLRLTARAAAVARAGDRAGVGVLLAMLKAIDD